MMDDGDLSDKDGEEVDTPGNSDGEGFETMDPGCSAGKHGARRRRGRVTSWTTDPRPVFTGLGLSCIE